MDEQTLNKALERHSAWIHGGGEAGTRAQLIGADLHEADLRGADLRHADLRGANLSGADLLGADLRGADLHDTTFRGIYVWRCNLKGRLISPDLLRGLLDCRLP